MGFSIRIIHVGRTGDLWRGPCSHYCSLLQRCVPVSLVAIKGSKGHGVATEQEGERLLERCLPGGYRAACTVQGATHDTRSFAAWLKDCRESKSGLNLLLGGAHGIAESAVRKCHEQISFSPLTFPHELCLVVVLEQLYRACTILSGHPYHK